MTVAESKTRAEAAERLGLKIRTLDDLLYRAYKTMGCRNIKEAEVILGSRGFANRSD
jgi:DNA-binding CsgD family transcriptional regulator